MDAVSRTLGLLIAIVAWLGIALSVQSAPRSILWERWTAHDRSSTTTVDHAPWTRLLKSYIRKSPDGVDRFAYAEVTPADRQALQDYINRLTSTPISTYNRDEQLAYWINLYFALSIVVILT